MHFPPSVVIWYPWLFFFFLFLPSCFLVGWAGFGCPSLHFVKRGFGVGIGYERTYARTKGMWYKLLEWDFSKGYGRRRRGVSCRVFSEEVLILQDTARWDKQVLALHYHGGIMPVLHL